jgi:hypothetical protein
VYSPRTAERVPEFLLHIDGDEAEGGQRFDVRSPVGACPQGCQSDRSLSLGISQ